MTSMTGFGAAHVKRPQYEIDVHIKTVNGRYLDVRFHIPRAYVPFEAEFKKNLSQNFVRGTVDVYIHRKVHLIPSQMKIVHQEGAAKKWLKAYQRMAKTLNLKDELALTDVLRLSPEFLRVEHSDSVSPEEERALLVSFGKAKNQCMRERRREGKALQSILLKEVQELQLQLGRMGKARQKANKKLKQRFADRMKKLTPDLKFDENRLAVEVALQLDKMDIAEEIARLKEHCSSFSKLLRTTQAKGKKLDFYTQEFLREVNTIGSKSFVSELTSAVVEAKSNIERIREQVQNVE